MFSQLVRRVAAGTSPCMRCASSAPRATAAEQVRTIVSSSAPVLSSASGKRSVAHNAYEAIRDAVGADFKPRAGVVLGSGLGPVADRFDVVARIPFADIPDFPVSSVSGHAGELLCANFEGVPLMALKGRVHMYEGVDPGSLRIPIYSMKLMGCEVLVVTSAVGSTREAVGAGSLVSITDHINLQGRNVLVGPNDDAIGTRFPDMTTAYDKHLRSLMKEYAAARGVEYPDGVLCSSLGPTFETPAEVRAFRALGADVLGMSMVAEVVSARHAGMRVSATGVVVNLAAGLTDNPITHEETIHFGNIAASNLTGLLQDFFRNADRW